LGSAKFIHHLRNLLGAVGAEAIPLDERDAPTLKFFLKYLNGVVDSSHVADSRASN
jgi:hypothetical protein